MYVIRITSAFKRRYWKVFVKEKTCSDLQQNHSGCCVEKREVEGHFKAFSLKS